jgi:ketosteroid isomerase-like protein
MKSIFFFTVLNLMVAPFVYAQKKISDDKQKQDISTLIDNYSLAREKKDTVLLKSILTTDIDQLVSSGEWRNGIQGSVNGMLRSSASNPGSRKLIVEKIRFLNKESAIADARYEIQNKDGTTRKMWSTFIVVYQKNSWKITAIRNMLPTGQP